MPSESWKSLSLPALLLVVLIISLSSLARARNPYFCMNAGNYTSDSTYAANLNSSLSTLLSNIIDVGFGSASVGQVHALLLCRTDRTLSQCRSCAQSAADDLRQQCPNQMQAIIWHEYCMLRYSNESIFETPTFDYAELLFNTQNVSADLDQFSGLLDELRAVAANGVVKGCGGSRNTSSSETIYGLVQCTPDLSPQNCSDCLNRGFITSSVFITITRGLRMLMPSCNIRYELYPFYNEDRLRQLGLLLPTASSPPLPPPPPGPGGRGHNITTLIVVPVAVCLLLLAACAIYLIRKKRMKRSPWSQEIHEKDTDDISTVESLQYDFGKIRAATNDFTEANKLGQGGFGTVYKGELSNGQEIAVKRLSNDSRQGNMEFKNEVLLVARLQHRNLVRLLGFSVEFTERLLIYEFVQNASLDQFIFDPEKRSLLDWDRRYKIIGGIARGLLYLHEDSRLRIIHRDLKASNVLLDGEMNPKIADFGMARLFGKDETQGSTNKIVGTYGYMSPEYAMHGQFSIKSDVFSFGVLLLEIMSGQRNKFIQREQNVENLLTFTWKSWREGTPENMIDPVLRADCASSLSNILRCIHIGLLCVQDNAANRPTMASILQMLSSSTMTLPLPLEPAFFMASRYGPNVSLYQEYDSRSNKGSSRNELSVSEIHPR